MAEQPGNPVSPDRRPDAAASAVAEPSLAEWRTSWQLPALVGAILFLGAGVFFAFVTAPKPDFDKMLGQAEQLIEKQDYDAAVKYLDEKVRPFVEPGQLAPAQLRRFHLGRARGIFLAAKRLDVESRENALTIIEEYRQGYGEEGISDPRDRYYAADANVTLGRYDEAAQIARLLPDSERANRTRIFRRIIQAKLAAADADAEEALRLLADFLQDPLLTHADRAWALARQSELLMRQGLVERAIAKLVQTMPSLVGTGEPEPLGELYLMLARAYWETGSLGDAERQLEQAVKLLPDTDARRGEAMVLAARIQEQVGQPAAEARADARQKYLYVVEHFGAAPVLLPALLGLSEIGAALGDFEASLASYRDLVTELNAGRRHPDVDARVVTASLMGRFQTCFDSGDTADAIQFVAAAEKLFTPDAVPPEVLRANGMARRRAADERIAATPGEQAVTRLTRLDPATREQARLELLAAAGYFKRHAERVGINDNAAFGASIWLAADSFDLAGDPDQAIPLFTDFVKFMPSDPRHAEARYRLGQACQLRGDYGMAAQYYRGLIAEGARGSGVFGDASLVPLAQTLLIDGDPANDAEGEQVLERVAQGAAGDPSSPQYRDALMELAALKRSRGDFAAAIKYLEEAAARFPSDERLDRILYDLALSYRQDARAILKTLDEGMPDHRKQTLQQARIERMTRASELFERVRRTLEGKDPRRLTELDGLQLRNSYFYLGDCAFDLGDFEGAIRHYDAAREKYSADPASLVAMVQIVNAYLEMGDQKRAETANNRARAFYASLPASVWSDPRLPMDREDWQKWLDSMSRLSSGADGAAQQAATPESER